MALFSRKREKSIDPALLPDEAAAAESDEQREAVGPQGPWDASHAPEGVATRDVGALRLPAQPQVPVRFEVDKRVGIVAVLVTVSNSILRVQAFAAPRSSGLWEERRAERAAALRKQGMEVGEADGPFGPELVALGAFRTPDGTVHRRQMRFLGVDGPRWLLEAMITGAGARAGENATAVEAYLRDVVVVRGVEARAPGDALLLTPPGVQAVRTPAEQGPQALTLPRRGPEITEVR